MTEPNDENLKRAFEALARDDARRAPAFENMACARPPRVAWLRVTAPVATLVAAAAALAVWVTSSGSSPPTGPRHVPAAVAPTLAPAPLDPAPLDFLLDVPGSSALATASQFDENPIPAKAPR